MHIGTWNLKLCPSPTSERGQAIAGWLEAQTADLWLLTEVHQDWAPTGSRVVVSSPRGSGPAVKRWAGVQTTLPLLPLRTTGDAGHPGEEGLRLARLQLDGPVPSSVLVSCSVLPWRGSGPSWPGLPPGQAASFRYVLDYHVARIAAERLPAEPLIWGGDFNQQLAPPFWAATTVGAAALRAAFDAFGLVALTEHAEHVNPAAYAIDHLAVSRDLLDGQPVTIAHRPASGGRPLSDHAAYTAAITAQTTGVLNSQVASPPSLTATP